MMDVDVPPYNSWLKALLSLVFRQGILYTFANGIFSLMIIRSKMIYMRKRDYKAKTNKIVVQSQSDEIGRTV